MAPPTVCIYQVSNSYFKTCRKSPENLKIPERTKIMAKIPNMRRNVCRKVYSGYQCTIFEEYILIDEAMIAKNGFDILLAVNYVKKSQLQWISSSSWRATYWKYIQSFKMTTQSMLEKSPENSHGLTDIAKA